MASRQSDVVDKMTLNSDVTVHDFNKIPLYITVRRTLEITYVSESHLAEGRSSK